LDTYKGIIRSKAVTGKLSLTRLTRTRSKLGIIIIIVTSLKGQLEIILFILEDGKHTLKKALIQRVLSLATGYHEEEEECSVTRSF